MTRKPTIYGPDGKPLVRVNDRLAPKPSKHASLEGWVEWQLVDRQGLAVRGGEQHNLILDTFLDAVAIGGAPLSNFPAFLSHYAVGTGSTPPDVADTALSNEVARTATQVASETARLSDGLYQLTLEREFDFAEANGNLTEFGFAAGVNADLLVRELFRDSSGNPITITKTNDYKLRIRYVLDVTLAPTVAAPVAFPIAGIGLINGQMSFIGGNPTGTTGSLDLIAFSYVARGLTPSNKTGIVVASAAPHALVYSNTTIIADRTDASSQTPSAFTQGVWDRSIESTSFNTATANFEIATLAVLAAPGGTANRAGWALVIDESDRFQKDNLHTLTINDLITVSWGRA